MKTPKTFVFRGKRFEIGRISRKRKQGDYIVIGECDHPLTKHKKIDIPIDGDTADDLDTIIHESLHACLPDIDEKSIDEVATAIQRLLWRLGWRKIDGVEE